MTWNPAISRHAPLQVRTFARLLWCASCLLDQAARVLSDWEHGMNSTYWKIADDCCDCAACEERRARGLQGPRKWANHNEFKGE